MDMSNYVSTFNAVSYLISLFGLTSDQLFYAKFYRQPIPAQACFKFFLKLEKRGVFPTDPFCRFSRIAPAIAGIFTTAQDEFLNGDE